MHMFITLSAILMLLTSSCVFALVPRSMGPVRAIHPKTALSLDSNNNLLSLGAPGARPESGVYTSTKGVTVNCTVQPLPDLAEVPKLLTNLANDLNDKKGVILTSSYEYPGRYSRWTVGFTDPLVQIEGRGMEFKVTALSPRGEVICSMIRAHLATMSNIFALEESSPGDEPVMVSGAVIPSSQDDAMDLTEENRSRQPSLFSLVREIRTLFGCDPITSYSDGHLGLYGSFGYDLTFQFEPIEMKIPRAEAQRDLVLYLPDEILVVDNKRNDAWKVSYEFSNTEGGTAGKPRSDARSPFIPLAPDSAEAASIKRDQEPGEFAASVDRAKEEFRVGNLFEVVLSQTFRERLATSKPSVVFNRLCKRNPSPYGFFMNLGMNEYLIGASPEMFVRVESAPGGMRVETCPISGTIQRGATALEDAKQIKKLLSSPKEESELTMCTDVDRNDKSRICVPGSVKVVGRRQIEMYSRLIHTVDHVEGLLRPEFDSLDAFLCHTWAVTVTGAPKTWAIRFVEEMEKTPREWYGGAVGLVGFDGHLNTGLTLRTMRIKDGVAEVRAGATLLHDSDPDAEEAETELKASALIDALLHGEEDGESGAVVGNVAPEDESSTEVGKDRTDMPNILLVDHEDSFVHTLANYLRQLGANVVTVRAGKHFDFIEKRVASGEFPLSLCVLSPGPGTPTDFKVSQTVSKMVELKVPVFGVCLGLQGIVEHFGGTLHVLDYPVHGKSSPVRRSLDACGGSGGVLQDMPEIFDVARYHSLYGGKRTFPNEHLDILAETAVDDDDDDDDDGIIMAVQHKKWPIAAVQFHPESILTTPRHGLQILRNALEKLDAATYD